MPLQTQRLVMVGLGSLVDAPPDAIQPPLRDGVHLRWAMARELGFPWYGFFLFRREHRRSELTCIGRGTGHLEPGPWPSTTLSIAYGEFSSDRPLVLTDDFAVAGIVEFDLRDRRYLRFTLSPGRVASVVEARIGFRETREALKPVRVTAQFSGVTEAETEVSGAPGQIVVARLEADAITSVEFSSEDAALIDVCFTPIDRGATAGWRPLERFKYPLALPVRHPDYPANSGATDVVASRNEALSRILYGPPAPWSASFPELHDTLRLLVAGGPGGTPMANKLLPSVAGVPSAPSGPAPHLADSPALDLVLLTTLNRAIAEMVGLSFVDETAVPGTRYDYLIVASWTGAGAKSAGAMLNEIAANGFANIDGYIVFNKALEPSPALTAPTGLRSYALPGSTLAAQGNALTDATNNAGLRWTISMSGGFLTPGQSVLYLVWRADCGNDNSPAAAPFNLLTKSPVLVADPVLPPGSTPQRASDWPPFPLHFIDIGLVEGWYGYTASGIDIFGRHSAQSADAQWFQWSPAPDPQPWYYINPPSTQVIHPTAVRLLDKSPPPPPTAIEAFALDPADPTVLRDAAYQTWFNSLSPAERQSVVGLRVRWQWTADQMRQAPDAAEFRIYFQPGRTNVLLGNISAVAAPSATETEVTTDIATAAVNDALIGASLRVGSLSFPIVGSTAGNPLKVRVSNLGLTVTAGTVSVANASADVTGAGTTWHAGMIGLQFNVAGTPEIYKILSVDSPTTLRLSSVYSEVTAAAQNYTVFDVRPPSSGAITIVIPERYAAGSVSATNGSATITGAGTKWAAPLVGMVFKVEGDAGQYRVAGVNSATELVLDRAYTGPTRTNLTYAITFPLFADYRVSTNWTDRVYVVGFNQHVQTTVDGAGRPLRKYEVLIPATGDAFRGGVPLVTSLADPVAYAQVSVSTADNRPHTPDSPKWAAGHFGNRLGNEGNVGSMATIFRVRREPPPPPAPPPDSERVFATPADYHGESFYTYRWTPLAHVRTHIFRAVDDAVFQEDWRHRPRPAMNPGDLSQFPVGEPRWDLLKRQQVSAELDQLNGFPQTPAGKAQALERYRALSNDALRVLAGLANNDRAFTQITTYTLDPDDAANLDRRGPDSPANYVPNAGLRAYVDTLDGRSTNRYFYRAAYVDGANNISPLSLSSPPVWLPNVVPPRSPVFTRILGGDRAVTVRWASNREADLARYRLYRTDTEGASRDLRLMTLVHEEVVPAGDPAARPAEVSFTDTPVQGLVTFYYRLVAVDSDDNASAPSASATGRAYDESLPVVPVPVVAWVNSAGVTRAQITWNSAEETMLQRRDPGRSWVELASWRPPGAYTIRDPFSEPQNTYEYRLWSRKATGAVSKGAGVTLVHE